MPADNTADDIFIDSNGRLTERIAFGGQDVVIHYDDIPESDITIVRGMRCTTALRTMIDIAAETDTAELERMTRECIERRLFSVPQALTRISEPDMANHRGAQLFRRALPL